MFGKAHWFRPKTIGWGLVPITWQGWMYTTAWSGVAVIPFLVLLGRHQPLEALIWMGLMIGGLVFDVWHILRSIRSSQETATAKRDKNVLYIMDSQPCHVAATRNYQLQAKR